MVGLRDQGGFFPPSRKCPSSVRRSTTNGFKFRYFGGNVWWHVTNVIDRQTYTRTLAEKPVLTNHCGPTNVRFRAKDTAFRVTKKILLVSFVLGADSLGFRKNMTQPSDEKNAMICFRFCLGTKFARFWPQRYKVSNQR